MKIVIDTNILISALIKDSLTRGLIVNKKSELIVPAYSLSEIGKYKEEICKRSKITNEEFYKLLDIILRNVKIIYPLFYSKYLNDAERIMKLIDIEDAPFLACAITFDAYIWSDDKHFKKQSKIKVLTTKEMIDIGK